MSKKNKVEIFKLEDRVLFEAGAVVQAAEAAAADQANNDAAGDGSAAALSCGKYYTPRGNSLTDVGVTPDLVMDLSDEDVLLLTNIPQKYMEHTMMTAYASVDGNSVTMLEDNGSANAEAPLTIVNTRGFDLPQTGDNGTMIFTVVGVIAMAGAMFVLFLVTRKGKKNDKK